MYNLIYSDNFFFNFIPSFIFLSLLTYSVFIKLQIGGKNIQLFSEFKPIILFYLFFSLIVFIFNLIVLFDYFFLFKHFKLYLFSIFIIIFLFFYNSINIKFNLKKKKFQRIDSFTYFFVLIFFLISILPITDPDSIASHTKVANHIYLYGLNNVNLFKDFEFLSIANSEILLILSPILNSDNFGSILNVFSLFILYLVLLRNDKKFIFFLLSCPLIVFFISTQKLQLFFGILYLLLFIILKRKLIKNKIDLFIFIFLLSFYATAKLSYVLLSIPLFFYFLIQNKKYIFHNLIYSLIVLLIFVLPLFLIKLKFFGNPVSPFFDNIFINNSREIYDAYAYILRSTGGWLDNVYDFKQYINVFFPTSTSQLTSTLGIIFVFQLCNIRLLKETNYLPIILILLIILSGQLIPRYYFEAFLILSFFYQNEGKIINYVKFFQAMFVITFSVIFIFISYINYNVINDKEKFMSRFSYGYLNNINYEKLSIDENILVANEGREVVFFKENIFTLRYIGAIHSYKGKKNNVVKKYIKQNSIKYIITDDINFFPKCLKFHEVRKINQYIAVRNFLINKNIIKSKVFKIDAAKC